MNEDPDRIDLIRELREAVGLFAGAMPVTPKVAWEEAIVEVKRLREKAEEVWWCETHGDVADDGATDVCHIGRGRDEHELCHGVPALLLADSEGGG